MSDDKYKTALERLMMVIDLHIFERDGKLHMNPLFLGQFAERVQEARDVLDDGGFPCGMGISE